jgi:hypothetical protein
MTKSKRREFWVSFVKNYAGQALPFHAFGSLCYSKALDDCSKGAEPSYVVELQDHETIIPKAQLEAAERLQKMVSGYLYSNLEPDDLDRALAEYRRVKKGE